MVEGIGPFAAICGEPRQIRKEATVAADSSAEMWLIPAASIYFYSRLFLSPSLRGREALGRGNPALNVSKKIDCHVANSHVAFKSFSVLVFSALSLFVMLSLHLFF